jgi:hypothetical protein
MINILINWYKMVKSITKSDNKAMALWTFDIFHILRKQRELFCKTFYQMALAHSKKLLRHKSQSQSYF